MDHELKIWTLNISQLAALSGVAPPDCCGKTEKSTRCGHESNLKLYRVG